MSGYTGAGPGAGAGGGIGAGGGAAADAPTDAFAQMGSRYPQFGMQGQGGAGGPMGSQLPSSVQRMPGGFGISPQLLQMISQLQAKTAPTGQQPFNVAQFQPKPWTPPQIYQNGKGTPYSPYGGSNGPR